MSSNSIDYHEGYLQCLKDMEQNVFYIYLESKHVDFITTKSKEHTEKICFILEEMYKVYKES